MARKMKPVLLLIAFVIFLKSFSQEHKDIDIIEFKVLSSVLDESLKELDSISVFIGVKKGPIVLLNKNNKSLKFYHNAKPVLPYQDTLQLKNNKGVELDILVNKQSAISSYKFKVQNLRNNTCFVYRLEFFSGQILESDFDSLNEVEFSFSQNKFIRRLKLPVLNEYSIVKVLNMSGEVVYSKEFDLPDIPYFDYSGLGYGVYVVELKTYDGIRKVKIKLTPPN